MTSWKAIVPLKAGDTRKGRLSSVLGPAERVTLTEWMADHVLGVLASVPEIDTIALLSQQPYGRWDVVTDHGRGLNAELTDIRRKWRNDPLLVIHADLPELTLQDVQALLAAAAGTVALAPDRHHSGTNAAAIPAGCDFAFAFGEDSLRRHRAAVPDANIVATPGLTRDIDTASDLAEWLEQPAPQASPPRPHFRSLKSPPSRTTG